MLDEDGYPAAADLEKIAHWDFSDFEGLMEFVQSVWWAAEWGFNKKKVDGHEEYHLSTGGWSGNEDIIQALRENVMFWTLYWVQSRRGGHYIFADRYNGVA